MAVVQAMAAMISVAAFAQEAPSRVPLRSRLPRVVAQPADGKSVTKFFLTACLPAVADPASVEVMAREHGWTRISVLQGTPSTWRANDFVVRTWTHGDGSMNPDVPACLVGIRPSREVKRDEFFDAISTSLEVVQ
jgi:hypothetical protein